MTEAEPKKKKKSGKFNPLIIVVFLALTAFLQHAFLFLFVALLPAIVAYIVDTKPKQPIFITVAALNFAGIVPYVFHIAMSANMLQSSVEVMSDPYSWLYIYSAASVGWLLILFCPAFCRGALKAMRRGQVMHLESQQKKLAEEWGAEVQRRGQS